MTDFSRLMNDYFTKYLSNQKNCSNNTMKTYRDCYVLLIEYMDNVKHISPYRLEVTNFNYDVISKFLDYLEIEKNVSISTRNNRLAALKSFFKYVSYREPKYLEICSSISEISKKKSISKPLNYLSIEAMTDFLSTFNQNDNEELRGLCIIGLLYESGARVSELANIKLQDFHLEKPFTVTLFGKGGKYRTIPIDYSLANVLKRYFKINKIKNEEYIFFNASRRKLTREGINYILQKYYNRARLNNPLLYPKNISPHCLRHSKAMHLLENNVNLIYIRDILGHSSVTTTEIYAKANPEIKRKYLEELSKKMNITDSYSPEEKNKLLDWLKNNI